MMGATLQTPPLAALEARVAHLSTAAAAPLRPDAADGYLCHPPIPALLHSYLALLLFQSATAQVRKNLATAALNVAAASAAAAQAVVVVAAAAVVAAVAAAKAAAPVCANPCVRASKPRLLPSKVLQWFALRTAPGHGEEDRLESSPG